MIEPISFASNYKVKTGRHNFNAQKKFRKFQSFSDGMVYYFPGVKADFNFESEKKYPYYFKGYILLSVPNRLDSVVENFCDKYEIKYEKSDN